jgi:hypothetical protein
MNDLVTNHRTAPESQRPNPYTFRANGGARPASGGRYTPGSRGRPTPRAPDQPLFGNLSREMKLCSLDQVARDLQIALLHRLELPCETAVRQQFAPWASLTFVGARHCFEIDCAPSEALIERLNRMSEEEFDLPHFLVADIETSLKGPGHQRGINIEILTVSTG